MSRFIRQREARKRLRFSKMGKRSQAVQRAKRMSGITTEYLAEVATEQPHGKGDPIGSLEFRDFITGKIWRWTILRGNRINNYQLRSPDGRTSKPHGLAWMLTKIRRVIINRSSTSKTTR